MDRWLAEKVAQLLEKIQRLRGLLQELQARHGRECRLELRNLHRAIVYEYDALGPDIPGTKDFRDALGFGTPVCADRKERVRRNQQVLALQRLFDHGRLVL